MENPFDIDHNGKVDWRDAQRALDEYKAQGSVKFIWGWVAGMATVLLPLAVWHAVF